MAETQNQPSSTSAPQNDKTSGAPDKMHQLPESQALNHLLSYPAVSDTVELLLEKNFVGRWGKSVTVFTFDTFWRPFLPIIYYPPVSFGAWPAKKADEIGDTLLSKAEEKAPVMKKPTDEVWQDTKSFAAYPYTHWKELYNEQNGKSETPEAYTTRARSVASSGLMFGSEALEALRKFIADKSNEARDAASKAAEDAKKKAGEFRDQASRKAGELSKKAGETMDMTKRKAGEAADQAKETANDVEGKAKKEGEKAADKAGAAASEAGKKME